MGKLGARELNCSSDIDLVLLYDPGCGVYSARRGAEAIGGITSCLARGIVTLVEARDAAGYVFRTDLRLGPDAAVKLPLFGVSLSWDYYATDFISPARFFFSMAMGLKYPRVECSLLAL